MCMLKVDILCKEMILNEVRKKYWLIGASTVIQSVIKNCIVCRKRQEKPSEQVMADLPLDRITACEPPFSKIGIDAFGPFMVSIRRSMEKRYGLIFTCLTSRATHPEIMFSLTTDSFLHALTRFIARRGRPQLIRCDNGTNFVSAEKELKKSIDQWNTKYLEESLLQKNISWKFNPPGASHHGGVWERQIRTIRKVLGALTNEQIIRFSDESLATLFCEIEYILNNRPLNPFLAIPKI